MKTKNENLPPQAIIVDRETFVDVTEGGSLSLNATSSQSARRLQGGPASIIGIIMVIFFFILKVWLHSG